MEVYLGFGGVHTWPVLGYYTVDGGSLDAIYDVVASARYKVAIAANFYIPLSRNVSVHVLRGSLLDASYMVLKFRP